MTTARYCCVAGSMFRYSEEPDGRQLYVTLENHEQVSGWARAWHALAEGIAVILDLPSTGGVEELGRTIPDAIGRLRLRASLPEFQTDAVRDVLAERARQTDQEGWTAAHDDRHVDGSLAAAAACYAMGPWTLRMETRALSEKSVPVWWPRSWSARWWKPKDRRRNLVRAAALLVAEIERIDRNG